MPQTRQREPEHILIVDDEPVILQILTAVFEGEPYRLTCVDTGVEALQVIETVGCDLLITDKNLPDINGMSLLRACKERDPMSEVIVITAYGSLDTAIRAVELHAFDYLLKPLDNVFEIRTKAERALEKRRLAVENRQLLQRLAMRNDDLEAALAESKALQAELIQAEKLAGIGTLAAGIAHEVSSPLFGILGLAEAVVDESEVSVIHGHAREMIDYCDSIREIVQELSSYSRVGEGPVLSPVHVVQCLEDARRLVERSLAPKGVQFSVDSEAGLEVCARQNEIQQVFVNLLKNAAEAVGEHRASGGLVAARCWRDGPWVQVTVRDNGPGITPDALGLVFDPFFTTKPPGKGTGLGLNVVYRIVTKYQGSIVVNNYTDAANQRLGAEFRVRLPAAGAS
jgi:C4-dicarboxylate-specific signal transduction histidine kinase